MINCMHHVKQTSWQKDPRDRNKPQYQTSARTLANNCIAVQNIFETFPHIKESHCNVIFESKNVLMHPAGFPLAQRSER